MTTKIATPTKSQLADAAVLVEAIAAAAENAALAGDAAQARHITAFARVVLSVAPSVERAWAEAEWAYAHQEAAAVACRAIRRCS